jgi:D-glycero-D-manno-heptose 1,7-bisphosphate phosphatase
MVKAVMFDRDGVISKLIDKHAAFKYEDFELYPTARAALNETKNHGFKNFVVTNQPDVNNGELTMEDLNRMHTLLMKRLPIDNIKVCTERNSHRYKPNTGMVDELIADYKIDVKNSFFVGDRWRDIVCGYRAGLTTILITNSETQNDWPEEFINIKPDYVVRSITKAVKLIAELDHEKHQSILRQRQMERHNPNGTRSYDKRIHDEPNVDGEEWSDGLRAVR